MENQKKEATSISTYKYSMSKNRPQESNPVKKSISNSWGLRRSKTTKENPREEQLGTKEVAAARKSVSCLETNLSSVIAFLQVRVLAADMPGSMQVHAFRCARRTYDTLEKLSPKQVAYNLKKEFDKVYGPAWHCIVGSSYGSFVTHSTGCFLYFSMDKLYVLMFKTKVLKYID